LSIRSAPVVLMFVWLVGLSWKTCLVTEKEKILELELAFLECLCFSFVFVCVICLCLFKFFEFQYYSALVTFLFVGFFPYSKNGYFSISFFILDPTNLVKYINLSIPLFLGD
jgi:hypothetical protein